MYRQGEWNYERRGFIRVWFFTYCTHHIRCKNCRYTVFMSLTSMLSVVEADHRSTSIHLGHRRSFYLRLFQRSTVLGNRKLDTSCAHLYSPKKSTPIDGPPFKNRSTMIRKIQTFLRASLLLRKINDSRVIHRIVGVLVKWMADFPIRHDHCSTNSKFSSVCV